MAMWMLVEGPLADGAPMRVYIAEHNDRLWSASLNDDEHPRSEDEFLWQLGSHCGSRLPWRRSDARSGSELLRAAAAQLSDYFAGHRLSFELPLDLRGTPFQIRVWQQLMQIPFGATRSYGDIAEAIGKPTACRAVGSANGRNNLPIFIPCHRVLASGGKLGGFTGGIGLKKRLLAHEAAVAGRSKAA